jgi:BirA family biotin operon repressor/biotin-[acetyl-CoA-carboxylase] ligase
MVLGIGLNVAVEPDDFPEDLRETAATMGRSAADVEPVLEEVLERLSAWLARPNDAVLEAFRGRDALRGRDVAWAGGEGVADGIDADGRLLVRTGSEVSALDAGEIHLRRR